MGVEDHRQAAGAAHPALRIAVITVSDTRTLESDESGMEISKRLAGAGHQVLERTVVPDDPGRIAWVLRHWLASDADTVILNGGTGIASRDGTVEVVHRFLDRELPGFGELFRALSFAEIGAAAMLSRALGGVARGKAVFALPGSKHAVMLAMERLILPELAHVVHEIRK
jgi:molybdenum cofactor biosynthesis protein B